MVSPLRKKVGHPPFYIDSVPPVLVRLHLVQDEVLAFA